MPPSCWNKFAPIFLREFGDLKPQQAVKIKIAYVAPLERVDRSLRVRFPTTIAPRYVSGAGSKDLLQTAIDADAFNPPHVLAVPYGMEMRVNVRLGAGVRGISSPTHAIKVERSAEQNENWSVEFDGQLAHWIATSYCSLILSVRPFPRCKWREDRMMPTTWP